MKEQPTDKRKKIETEITRKGKTVKVQKFEGDTHYILVKENE